MKGTTIIIPTFNEEGNIGGMVSRLKALYPEARIIVADDGSRDRTQAVVTQLGLEGVRVLDRSKSASKGLTAAVVDAASLVKTGKLVVIDADFQHPPEKVGEIAGALEKYDIVVGTRAGTPGWPLSRRLISKGGTLLARLRLWVSRAPNVSDPMSGFFGARTGLFNKAAKARRKSFVDGGFKVLFDFVKHLPKTTKVGIVVYKFGLRSAGVSKIGKKHILLLLRSILS
jgi:dolichol-phosphate mannosyltransferase